MKSAVHFLWLGCALISRVAAADAVTLPAMTAIDGKAIDASSLAGKAAVVLAWTDLECPMAKLYLPRLGALADELRQRGVEVIVVDSTRDDSAEALAARARELGLKSPLVRDADGAVARALGAVRTTEVVVLDRELRLAYRGAVDDQYGYRRGAGQGPGTYRKEKPDRHYLRDALEAILAGKKPDPADTDPLGCEITLPVRAGAGASIPTYHEHVEPILERRCQGCHRRGAGAPFALETFEDARRRARMLREVVRDRRMPPWSADRAIGKFANDPSLGEREIETIVAWAEGGAPRGVPAAAPPQRAIPGEWEIGAPDAVFETPPFEVPATGVLPYRYVRLKNDAAEDRWVEAAQVRSTGAGTVHHVLIFLEKIPPPPAGVERPWQPPFNPLTLLEGARPSEYAAWIERFKKYLKHDFRIGAAGGLNGYFVSSNAGEQPTVLPQGTARLLPAGATLVLQIHYTPTGKQLASTTRLGLRFAKGPRPRALDSRGIATVAFKIPPGAGSHPVQATFTFPRDATLRSFRPHMHLRGRSFQYVLEPPGEKGKEAAETLLSVPAWDFDSQVDYILAEPRRIAAGSRLRAIAIYDNSAANPYNPDPSREVYFGLQSDEEMMIGYFDAVWDEGDGNS